MPELDMLFVSCGFALVVMVQLRAYVMQQEALVVVAVLEPIGVDVHLCFTQAAWRSWKYLSLNRLLTYGMAQLSSRVPKTKYAELV